MVRLLVILTGLLLCGCSSLRREVRTEERKDSVRVVKTEAVSIRERVALYVPTDSAGVLALLGLGGLVVPSCEAAAEGWADVGAKEGGAAMVAKKGGGRARDKPVGVVAVVEREIITSNSEDSVSINELTTMEEEEREAPRGGLGCWWWFGAVVGLVLVAVMRR